jgi:predicted DNA binding CopG/RHH family protein
MVDREKRINVRVSDVELEMLSVLAEADGVSQSDFLRLHIRKVYAERFSTKPAKPKH